MNVACAERNRSPFVSSRARNIVLVLIVPAAELLFVEKSNLKYQLFTVNANKVRLSYSYRAIVSLDTEIKADSWTAGLDIMKIWTIHIQECCEGTWHELVENATKSAMLIF